MMLEPLFRTKLRADAAAILGGLDAFAGRVFNMRMPALRRTTLPAVRLVTFADTRVNSAAAHDIGVLDGSLTLTVQIIVENGADPDASERLDWLCSLAETALLSNAAFRREVRYIESIGTTIDLDVQGELRTAIANMDFVVHYTDCFELVIDDELKTMRFRLDFIDPPADPNTSSPPANVPDGYLGGHPGPDGRIEYEFEAFHAQEAARDGAAARRPTDARAASTAGDETNRGG